MYVIYNEVEEAKMKDTKQLVTIKGTRDGLTFIIDDRCNFEDAFVELTEKIKKYRSDQNAPIVGVTLKLGYRYLHDDDKKKIDALVGVENRLKIENYESRIVLRTEALRWIDESEVKTITKVIRSGQVLKITGDLLLIGDVNPGGQIEATGNIYVMGYLHGIAHAGVEGNEQTMIIASHMKPNQLRIADYISRAPDYETEGIDMGCGLIEESEKRILIEPLQDLSHKKRALDGFKRRMQNG